MLDGVEGRGEMVEGRAVANRLLGVVGVDRSVGQSVAQYPSVRQDRNLRMDGGTRRPIEEQDEAIARRGRRVRG